MNFIKYSKIYFSQYLLKHDLSNIIITYDDINLDNSDRISNLLLYILTFINAAMEYQNTNRTA